jgi:hypothetical protein
MIDVSCTCRPPSWLRMLPQALMLAPTMSVVELFPAPETAGEAFGDVLHDTTLNAIAAAAADSRILRGGIGLSGSVSDPRTYGRARYLS